MPQSFFQMLLSRLSPEGARLYGTTNPDSPYHWLKTDYLDNPDCAWLESCGQNISRWRTIPI